MLLLAWIIPPAFGAFVHVCRINKRRAAAYCELDKRLKASGDLRTVNQILSAYDRAPHGEDEENRYLIEKINVAKTKGLVKDWFFTWSVFLMFCLVFLSFEPDF